MAKRFVRVDLSGGARDFRPIALEPGVPMLDTAGANGRIIHRWLGDLAGEPEIVGESVNYYVRTDQGGRLEDVACQPATEEDLRGPLNGELRKIEERLQAAKGDNSTERLLLRVLRENFDDLAHNEARSDRSNYFFKYTDVLGRPRIVWCWGFQRMDLEPAPTALCADENCSLLFLRRPGHSPKCPACQAALPTQPKKRRSKRPAVLLLLLFLATLAVAAWFWNRNRLIARPSEWVGPEGATIEFRVFRPGPFGWGEREVTGQAVAVAADARVVRIEPAGSAGVAWSQGSTTIHFHYRGRFTTAAVTVTELGRPERVSLEPSLVELAVGTTQRLRLIGHYAGNKTADLTAAAEWVPTGDGVVYAAGGLLEGLNVGTSTVTARLACPQPADAPPEGTDDPALKPAGDGTWYRLERLEATANVSVGDFGLASIDAAVEPQSLALGRSGILRIDAVTGDGRRFSVLESSRLTLAVEPASSAAVVGKTLRADQLGLARLRAKFESLSGEARFEVVAGTAIDSLLVVPESLHINVGEIADLSIASPTRGRIEAASSDPAVLDVTAGNRLVGRAEGTAVVTVSQGDQSRTVQVSVGNEEIRKLEISPSGVVVPVDHTRQVLVFGRLADGRRVELAPESFKAETVPSPLYADFDPRPARLTGRSPTSADLPQSLSLHRGALTDSVPVQVIVAPFRLELTPPGLVELPLGQMLSLDAWANYAGGHRVQLLPERAQWDAQPSQADPPGVELRGHKVAALRAGSGPLSVGATYFGLAGSNRVEVKSVAAEEIKLRMQLDRTLRVAGEPGTIAVDGVGPRGYVELVPELAQFNSNSPDVAAPEGNLGAFLAAAPGQATMTVTHPAAREPAALDLVVLDPAKSRLVLEPASVQAAVHEAATVRLYLEGLHNDQVERAEMAGPGVSYSIEKPEAVLWRPPMLVGRSPAAPFEMSAGYLPYLARPAAARIEVVDAAGPTALRVVPAEADLASDEVVSLKIEAQWPGNDAWREVQPDAVHWTVPDEIRWTDSGGGLCPSAGMAPGTTGGYVLKAHFADQQATVRIGTRQPTLDPADPAVALRVDREPGGRYLPIGQSQRYRIVLQRGDAQETAAEVVWPPDFDNDYVRWRAPILSATQAGYQQWLTARVGGRTVRFDVQTIDPMQPSTLPPRRPDQPVEVRVVSDQGLSVTLPVGALFDDFRVEALYEDGFVRMVTRKATMRLGGGELRGPVSFSEGTMIGVQPGSAVVEAEFDGVSSKGGLQVTVSDKIDIDEIRVSPELVKLLPGESVALEAIGYKGGNSIGRITGMAGLTWSSSDPRVAQPSGSTVSGLAVGLASVTARHDSIAGAAARIQVLESIDDALVVDQDTLEMIVGESRRIGADFGVFRGDTDFSRWAQVTSALPGVVRYDEPTHSLVAVAPGAAGVTFAWGDKLATTQVRVLPAGVLDGRVVVEPSSGVLSPGQAVELRIYAVTSDGRRIDRTTSAVLTSSDPAAVSIQGNLACARSAGAAEITALLPEVTAPGRSLVTVNAAPIDELIVEPSRLALSVGETVRLRVMGRSESGTSLLFVGPDLQLSASGSSPGIVRVLGPDVQGTAPGQTDVAVAYQNRLSATVPVTVSDDPWTGLVLDPVRATVHPGQGVVYQASALRGGRRLVVTPADGLYLTTSNPAVARVVGGTAVEAVGLGRGAVIAQSGGRSAEAAIDVVPGTGPVGTVIPGDTTVYGPGYGHFGTEYIVRGGPGYVVDGGDAPRAARPVGTGVGLRFSPDMLRVGMNSPGTLVRVLEVFADGYTQDVSRDPALEFTTPGDVARLEKMTAGPVLRPVRPGQSRMSARLGNLVTLPELLIQVGDYGSVGARLEVYPPTLELADKEAGRFASVQVDLGAGQAPFPVAYTIELPSGQGIVGATADGNLRGLSDGALRVVVRANAPGTPYDGVSAMASVRVSSIALSIQPADVSLKVGETTPPMTVLAHETGRPPYPVPAELESLDPQVLSPAGLADTRFAALALGGTQIRATYRGRDALAGVTVTGERFLAVDTSLDGGTSDFTVRIEVLAAGSEGPLEYRVTAAGQPPAEEWVPGQPQGTQQRAVLSSSRISYGDRTARYSLILEARPQGGGPAQRYPFTFRLESRIVEDRP
ncbi:MAG: hypothetical protein ACYC6Y_01565 [Thermoguttaceae bacterium]